MEKRDIYKHSKSFIGGQQEIYEYLNEDESKKIEIMTCKNSEYSGVDVFSTIGLSEIDINLKSDEKNVGVELIAIGDKNDELIANIISTVAFEIMDSHKCYYGDIFPDIINKYDEECEVKHVILLDPSFWDNYSMLESDKQIVVWLLVVPITENEKNYIVKNGLERFENLLSIQEGDITDRRRKSFV